MTDENDVRRDVTRPNATLSDILRKPDIKPEFAALIARGNVTLAEVKELRGNSADWRALVPALDNEAFIHTFEHCIDNCGVSRLGREGTYDYALQHVYAPEAARRLRAR
jgi:hypothetical protein